MIGKKKGNIDTDIVFIIMSKIAGQENFDDVVLVSGDGDYYKMVKYLIENKRFKKLLAPNRDSTSSLYRPFTPKYVDFLDNVDVKKKIEYKKKQKKQKNGLFLGIAPFESPVSEYILIISQHYTICQ